MEIACVSYSAPKHTYTIGRSPCICELTHELFDSLEGFPKRLFEKGVTVGPQLAVRFEYEQQNVPY